MKQTVELINVIVLKFLYMALGTISTGEKDPAGRPMGSIIATTRGNFQASLHQLLGEVGQQWSGCTGILILKRILPQKNFYCPNLIFCLEACRNDRKGAIPHPRKQRRISLGSGARNFFVVGSLERNFLL